MKGRARRRSGRTSGRRGGCRPAALLHSRDEHLYDHGIAGLRREVCGAADDLDAPAPAERSECPRLSSYLDGLVELIDAGRLDHLRAVLADDLSDDQRADLVVAVIRLAGAFEPGAFVALGDVSDLIASSDDLQALVRGLAPTRCLGSRSGLASASWRTSPAARPWRSTSRTRASSGASSGSTSTQRSPCSPGSTSALRPGCPSASRGGGRTRSALACRSTSAKRRR